MRKMLWTGLALVLLCGTLSTLDTFAGDPPAGTYTAEEEGGLIVPFSCGGGECALEGWCAGEVASYDGCSVQCFEVEDDGWLTPTGSADCAGEI